ncbi:MAG: hypothetical protein Q8Q09_24565 [Deltaproteobacteria bacterium]|nr:hypothetical protein [Deltaproteobacteria bacterium]
MSDDASEFLERHGIAIAEIAPVVSGEVASRRVAEGLASSQPLTSQDLEAATVLEPMSDRLHAIGAVQAALVASPWRAGVYALDAEGLSVEFSRGVARMDDDRLLIDGRDGRQHVVCTRGTSRVLLSFEGPRHWLYELAAPSSVGLSVEIEIMAEIPDLSVIAPEVKVPTWMHVRYAAASRGESLYGRVAAVGVVGRLLPTGAMLEAWGAGALRAMLSAEDPASRADRWWRSLDVRVRGAAGMLALRECDDLEADLEELVAMCSEQANQGATRATRWFERRDDLESIAQLLRDDPSGALVREQLAQLDERARMLATTWAELGQTPSDQLQTSAREDPGTWWTTSLSRSS